MILLELVPKQIDALISQIHEIGKKYPEIDGYNIPDIKAIKNRSYQCAEELLKQRITAIPHIRSIDNSIQKTLTIIGNLKNRGLERVLIVSGDNNKKIPTKKYSISSVKLISRIKQTHPSLKVYGALDSYRTSAKKELLYCQQKIDAGADGFFTQPFFCEKDASYYLEKLKHTNLYIGLSPVLTEKTKQYWETVNNVKFDSRFKLTMNYNHDIGKKIIELTKQYKQSLYLMPITTDPMQYLSGIFN